MHLKQRLKETLHQRHLYKLLYRVVLSSYDNYDLPLKHIGSFGVEGSVSEYSLYIQPKAGYYATPKVIVYHKDSVKPIGTFTVDFLGDYSISEVTGESQVFLDQYGNQLHDSFDSVKGEITQAIIKKNEDQGFMGFVSELILTGEQGLLLLDEGRQLYTLKLSKDGTVILKRDKRSRKMGSLSENSNVEDLKLLYQEIMIKGKYVIINHKDPLPIKSISTFDVLARIYKRGDIFYRVLLNQLEHDNELEVYLGLDEVIANFIVMKENDPNYATIEEQLKSKIENDPWLSWLYDWVLSTHKYQFDPLPILGLPGYNFKINEPLLHNPYNGLSLMVLKGDKAEIIHTNKILRQLDNPFRYRSYTKALQEKYNILAYIKLTGLLDKLLPSYPIENEEVPMYMKTLLSQSLDLRLLWCYYTESLNAKKQSSSILPNLNNLNYTIAIG